MGFSYLVVYVEPIFLDFIYYLRAHRLDRSSKLLGVASQRTNNERTDEPTNQSYPSNFTKIILIGRDRASSFTADGHLFFL